MPEQREQRLATDMYMGPCRVKLWDDAEELLSCHEGVFSSKNPAGPVVSYVNLSVSGYLACQQLQPVFQGTSRPGTK